MTDRQPYIDDSSIPLSERYRASAKMAYEEADCYDEGTPEHSRAIDAGDDFNRLANESAVREMLAMLDQDDMPRSQLRMITGLTDREIDVLGGLPEPCLETIAIGNKVVVRCGLEKGHPEPHSSI